jgi:hypothetical protein
MTEEDDVPCFVCGKPSGVKRQIYNRWGERYNDLRAPYPGKAWCAEHAPKYPIVPWPT